MGGINGALEKCLADPVFVGITTGNNQKLVWFYKAGHGAAYNQNEWTSYDCSSMYTAT